MPSRETRNVKLYLRLPASAKKILQDAAISSSKSVSEFVLECALARAAELLPDRHRFGLSAEKWKAFVAAMDAPLQPSLRLKKLLGTPSVFERGGLS